MASGTSAQRKRSARLLVALGSVVLVLAAGVPAAHASPTVPDAPTIKTVTPEDGGVTVDYDVANDGGSTIVSFTATCNSSDGGVPGTVTFLGSSPQAISVPATNGNTYTCVVRATNGVGDSPDSATSNAVVAGTPTIGDGAYMLRANGKIYVGPASDPVDNGSAITSYTAHCTSSDGGTPGTATGQGVPLLIDNLDNGKTYTCTIVATNARGTGPVSSKGQTPAVPAAVPDPIFEHTLIPGDRQISIAFTPPNDAGSPILGYTARCDSTDGGTSNQVVQLTAPPVVVTGLDNGHTYYCAAFATNANGDGSFAAWFDTAVPAAVPDAPPQPTIVAGDAQITVTFGTPNDNGSAITRYDATCSSAGGGTTGTNHDVISPIVVTGLTNGTIYTCSVTATNAMGTSAASADSASDEPTGAPPAPAQPSVVFGNASATVTFSPPISDGGSPITGYTAQCVSNDGGTTQTQPGTGSPITVTTLDNGFTYTCAVAATSNLGTGPYSTASTSGVPATVPDAPGKPTPTPSNTSVSLAFSVPGNDGGATITEYDATCTSNDGGATRTGSAISSPVTVGNLSKGTHYTCSVAATNGAGTGVSSADSDAFAIDTTVPGAPDEPAIAQHDGSITVTFPAPADTGGLAVSGYTATCTSSNGGATGSQAGGGSPLTVTGITNGKTYTCTVHASNTDGDGAESAASGAVLVAGAPADTVPPKVQGSVVAERTVTATTGTWSGYPAPSFARQWQRCNTKGTGCVNIAGATKTTYTITNADIGKRLRIVVRATNVAGTATATSLTAVVRAVPTSISGPYYYERGRAYHSIVFTVAAAAYGDTVWATTMDGYVVGPHFGPHGGTLVGTHLKKPIVGMQVTPDGRGYWLFAGDGGVFTFGDAHFYGSTGALHLRAPIVSMATTPSGKGYWLFAADGGVFTYGDARYYGSTGAMKLSHPVVAMLPTLTGHGYWLVTSDGRALRFGDATNIGSVANLHRTDIIGLVSTGAGYRFVTRSLQLLKPR